MATQEIENNKVSESTASRRNELLKSRDWMIATGVKSLESFEKAMLTLIGASFAGSLVYIEKVSAASHPFGLFFALVGFGLSMIIILLSLLLTHHAHEKAISEIIDAELRTGVPGKLSKECVFISKVIGYMNWTAFALFSLGLVGFIIFVLSNLI